MKSAKNRNILPLKEITELRRRIARLEKENTDLKKELKYRKKHEKILRQSEELYRTLVRTSPDSIGIMDMQGYYIDASDQTAKLLGYEKPKEIIGKRYWDIIAPKDLQKAKKAFQEIMKKGHIKHLILSFLKKDGTCVIGESNASIVSDAYEKPKVVIGITRDISERKKDEEKLKESAQMYKTLVKTSPDAVNVINLDGINIETSNKTVEILGYKKEEELLGRYMLEHIAPEDHKKCVAIFELVQKKEFVRNAEIIFMRRDRTRFIGETNAQLIKDASGNPKAIIGTIRDITERKKMQEKLKQYSENLEHMVKERTQ
jgi:PAS domain S-box-containing protein